MLRFPPSHAAAFCFALLATPAEAVIYLSEAYPNPCGQEGVNGAIEGLEWFEITNPDATAVALNGYTIADNTTNATTTNRFRISSLSIAPGATVVFSGLPLASFNSTYGTSLTTLQYYEIPASPTWTSGGGASGMSNAGWLNNGAGDNLRIFTDAAATVELAGAYRPATSFPGTTNGQSFYWNGVTADWTLNTTGGSPAGFEANDPGCPVYANPGATGASVPEAGSSLLVGLALIPGLSRRRR
jgi:Lamin Tail Domain